MRATLFLLVLCIGALMIGCDEEKITYIFQGSNGVGSQLCPAPTVNSVTRNICYTNDTIETEDFSNATDRSNQNVYTMVMT